MFKSMDFAISDQAMDVVRGKGGTVAIDYIQPVSYTHLTLPTTPYV